MKQFSGCYDETFACEEHFINKKHMTEFYDEIEQQMQQCPVKGNVLVLGCGVGHEIERIKFTCTVTVLNRSSELLDKLMSRNFYSKVKLQPVYQSFLDFNYEKNKYDMILACYSLHYYNEEQMEKIFSNIYNSLKPDGFLVIGDSISETEREEKRKLKTAMETYEKQQLPFASLDIEVPFTEKTELTLLRKAGFKVITIERRWPKATLYRCVK